MNSNSFPLVRLGTKLSDHNGLTVLGSKKTWWNLAVREYANDKFQYHWHFQDNKTCLSPYDSFELYLNSEKNKIKLLFKKT